MRGGISTSKRFTLVSSEEAKNSLIFIYEGMLDKCVECEYRKVCHNLQPKKSYQIIQVKDKIVNCKVFSSKMKLVEIKIAEIKAAVDPKFAIEGATIEFKPQECSKIQCEKFDECVPHIIDQNEKYKIIGIIKRFSCPNSGKSLAEVSLLPHRIS